jgi:hypothetical protein
MEGRAKSQKEKYKEIIFIWLAQYHQTKIIIHSNLIGKQPNYFILIYNNTIHF